MWLLSLLGRAEDNLDDKGSCTSQTFLVLIMKVLQLVVDLPPVANFLFQAAQL